MRTQPGSISVVVPVYGDGGDIDALVTRLQAVLDGTASWELILVNDGSPRPTWDLIQRLAASRPSIKGIDLQRNAGQHNALLAGIRASTGDVVITMDDDLQHPPEEVPVLLQRLLTSGDDIVYGMPGAPRHGHRRQVGARLSRRFVAFASGMPQARVVSAFRAFRGTLRSAFTAHAGSRVFIDGVLLRATSKVSGVAVRHDPRGRGQSGYTFASLIAICADMIVAFGMLRRRLLALCAGGVGAMAAGLALWPDVADESSITRELSWTAIGSLAAIGLGAAVLLGVGLGWIYIARHAAAGSRGPGYAIRTATHGDAGDRDQELTIR